MMVIRSKIYSMDFWQLSDFTYENIRFERIGTFDEYKKIRDRIQKENVHLQTGIVTITIPEEITTKEQAKEYVMNLQTNLWILLSFAHGHDVPFQGLYFYEIEDGREIEKGWEIHRIRMGKPGKGVCWNMVHGLNKFIETALPLLENEDFISKTNVKNAMIWYNESKNLGLVEVKFQCLWVALEGLAQTYNKGNPMVSALSNGEWRQLKRVFKDFLVRINKKEDLPKLLQRFSFLREGPIVDKIAHLLAEYNLSQYSPEIRFFNQMRSNIIHARELDLDSKPDPFEKTFRLERLLEKIIFKVLNFYDNDMIHHAIRAESLSARS